VPRLRPVQTRGRGGAGVARHRGGPRSPVVRAADRWTPVRGLTCWDRVVTQWDAVVGSPPCCLPSWTRPGCASTATRSSSPTSAGTSTAGPAAPPTTPVTSRVRSSSTWTAGWPRTPGPTRGGTRCRSRRSSPRAWPRSASGTTIPWWPTTTPAGWSPPGWSGCCGSPGTTRPCSTGARRRGTGRWSRPSRSGLRRCSPPARGRRSGWPGSTTSSTRPRWCSTRATPSATAGTGSRWTRAPATCPARSTCRAGPTSAPTAASCRSSSCAPPSPRPGSPPTATWCPTAARG
jgi:hypothetical protein